MSPHNPAFTHFTHIGFSRARAERVYCKELGATKLQYPEFLLALQKIGVKRQTGLDEVITKVLKHGRCRREHTMADFIIFDALSEPDLIKTFSTKWVVLCHFLSVTLYPSTFLNKQPSIATTASCIQRKNAAKIFCLKNLLFWCRT